MAYDLWDAGSLYENEDLTKPEYQLSVIPVEQGPDKGNCGTVSDRGKAACETVGKLTKNRCPAVMLDTFRRSSLCTQKKPADLRRAS